jgi:hypothetical protein
LSAAEGSAKRYAIKWKKSVCAMLTRAAHAHLAWTWAVGRRHDALPLHLLHHPGGTVVSDSEAALDH